MTLPTEDMVRELVVSIHRPGRYNPPPCNIQEFLVIVNICRPYFEVSTRIESETTRTRIELALSRNIPVSEVVAVVTKSDRLDQCIDELMDYGRLSLKEILDMFEGIV